MKKFLTLILIFLILPTLLAQSCEGGCSAPGDCGAYTDSNENNLCDYGEKETEVKKPLSSKYNFVPVSLILIILYLISHLFSKEKIISIKNHRRIWNILLLFSFLGAGITGILLILRINYGYFISVPINLLYWHVETGIVMSLISIFHIVWHWPYFKLILKS